MSQRSRSLMTLGLSRVLSTRTWPCRRLERSDARDLADLLYAAFHGTVDDEGESHAEAVQEIDRTLNGAYGRLLWDASFVIEQGDVLVSACVATWYEPLDAPFVAFTMTRPEHKNRGMARSVMQRSIHALLDAGHSSLWLLVTDANVPAVRLYTSLGFRKADEHPRS